MKAALSQNEIPYVSVDITSGMLPLKQFLKYRDTHPAFAPVREKGRVGVPCLVVNKGEQIFFDLPEDLNTLR